MHIHILGIAGTFMGSLALIAKQLGHTVTGQDAGVYPPISTQLAEQNIQYSEGYDAADLPDEADIFIIGNALSRGNLAVEAILNQQLPYTSGAEWLAKNVLHNKWVLAVAGTHGKTTTASMLTQILDDAGLDPSFLIGGIVQNFNCSARLTNSNFFVVEADEYDTAFFDKRSKFVHYHPKTLVINNLEFDHADIFDNLAAIQTQFHHLIRTVPSDGAIIYPENQANISQVLEQGLWSDVLNFASPKLKTTKSGSEFLIDNKHNISWDLLGQHNAENATAAAFAAHHIGVPFVISSESLSKFKGVKRRLEVKYQSPKTTLYDDFAHHPTAIKTTLSGLRAKVGGEKITVILELASNTMKSGRHQKTLKNALSDADLVLVLRPKDITWDIDFALNDPKITLLTSTAEIIAKLNDDGHIVVMSNSGFDGIIDKISRQLKSH